MSSPIERYKALKKSKEYPNFFNPCSKDIEILNTKSIYKDYPEINNNEVRQDDLISSKLQIIKSTIRPDIYKIKNENRWNNIFTCIILFSKLLLNEQCIILASGYWPKN